MAVTERREPERLQPADVSEALALSREAGWNQTPQDWCMMLSLGHALGFRSASGALVATGLALPFGRRIGWVSMVLVTASHRRQGLATRLVEACTAWLEHSGRAAVLDATPDGEAVYSRMGFRRQLALTRWQRAARPPAARPPAVMPAGIRRAEPADLSWVARLDREVFGAERAPVLDNLLGRPDVWAFATRGRDGFLLGRAGERATQIGPISAREPAQGRTLLDAALARIAGPVFIDAFDAQPAFGARLGELGFEIQRPFARMVRGEAAPLGDARRAVAAAGPELG